MPKTPPSERFYQKRKIPLPLTLLQRFISLVLLGIITLTLVDFPIAKNWIGLGLGAYALLLWRFPSAWLLIIPTLLPVLDFTPWSGRIFFGEFDLLILTTCAAGYWRKDPWIGSLQFSRRTWLLILLLIIWQTYTTLNGLLPLQPIDANSFTSYYSQYNSLRIAKGFFFALMLLPLLGQAISQNRSITKLFTLGMLGGLVTAISAIIWERLLFTNLFDFDTAYRTTGLFSGMATGGAAVDAHLAMSLPFITYVFLAWKKLGTKRLGIILLAVTIYSLAVTFSRANYLAIALILSTLIPTWIYYRKHNAIKYFNSNKYLYLAFCIVILTLTPVLGGKYLPSRISTIVQDFNVRITHWTDATNMMGDEWGNYVFGMGKGTFPQINFWSQSLNKLPATLQHIDKAGNGFIRYGKSDKDGNLFLRQRFKIPEEEPYKLSINLRPRTNKQTRLLIEICERLIFQPFRECRWMGINTHANSNRWVNFNKTFSTSGLGDTRWYGRRPVEIAILNRGLSEGIDIDNVQITTPSGKHLLHNSDFSSGLDHWTFYSGNHLAWHIKNIGVYIFFEGGWLGLACWLTLVLFLICRFITRLKDGDGFPILIFPAFAGLIAVGFFDSLFDEPKITLLFFIGSWITLAGPATYLDLSQPQPHKNPFLYRLEKAYSNTPAGYKISFDILLVFLIISTLFWGATKHYEVTPRKLVLKALQKNGIKDGLIIKLLTPKPKYQDQPIVGKIRSTHPRILLPELSEWGGNGSAAFIQHRNDAYKTQGIEAPDPCQYGGILGLSSCWVTSGNHKVAKKLTEKLITSHIIMPKTSGEYGNCWEFAIAYDFLSLYPGLSNSNRLRIERKLYAALQHSLQLLDKDDLSLWHGRTTLSATAWLCAIVLNQSNPDNHALTKRAQGHFLEMMKALALTEAWPEGYNYWINSRGFLVSLAATAYLNSIENNTASTNKIRSTLRRIGYWHLYATRPDNRIQGFGDEGPRIDLKDETRRVIDLIVQATRDPILAAYSKYIGKLHGQASYYSAYRWGFKLFNDPTVKPTTNADFLEFANNLSTSELFGAGAMNMAYIRSGWTKNDTFISFRAGDTFTQHGHYDAGHFTLFKSAPLAINSSNYGNFFGANRLNYSIRTIAKNSLIIQRPNEKVRPNHFFKDNVSDGGQRITLPTGSAITSVDHWRQNLQKGLHLEGGSINRYEHKPGHFTYLSADLTPAYNTPTHDEGGDGGKVSAVQRQFLYLDKEDRLIIYDQIIATDPTYKKKWLLHTVNQPSVDNLNILKGSSNNGIMESTSTQAIVRNGRGILSVQRILPADGIIRLVGGKDFQYYVETDGDDKVLDGKNYYKGAVNKPWFDIGKWRIEIQPKGSRIKDKFLIVMTIGIDSLPAHNSKQLKIISGNATGVVTDLSATIFVDFSTSNSIKLRIPAGTNLLRIICKDCYNSLHLIHAKEKVKLPLATKFIYEVKLKETTGSEITLISK